MEAVETDPVDPGMVAMAVVGNVECPRKGNQQRSKTTIIPRAVNGDVVRLFL